MAYAETLSLYTEVSCWDAKLDCFVGQTPGKPEVVSLSDGKMVFLLPHSFYPSVYCLAYSAVAYQSEAGACAIENCECAFCFRD